MPESNSAPAQRRISALEFIVGQHSLFFAAGGLAFFYIHLFKPYFPVWLAVPFFMVPWAVVFLLFFTNRPLFPPRTTRRYWLYAACGYAAFTLIAEMIWLFGDVPPFMPKPPSTPALSIMVIQVLMNIGWLSFVPILHDYLLNPHQWK